MNNPSRPLTVVRTPPRRHKGSTLLSPRDRWAFQWIAQQYALSLEHLPWLLGQRAGYGAKSPHRISESAARQVLARWHKQGYIEQKNIFTDSSPWIWPSKAAMDELGLGYSYAVPHFASLPHLHAVSHVRLSLEQLHPDGSWKSERQLKAEYPRSSAWATPLHIPDGQWRSATTQDVTAIEVEVSLKKASEWKRLLVDVTARYPSVCYFALREPYQALADVIAGLPASVRARVSLSELERFQPYYPLTL